MRQYRQIKERYPDTILLYRLGDFYETFGDDAVRTAQACGITLTKRNNGGGTAIPLAGFPHHQLDVYLPKLVRGGYRVAVCEQLEDPKQAKGIVKRDVVEVVTPGVVMYDKLLDTSSHTYVACITAQGGLSLCDVSTGSFLAGEVAVPRMASLLESFRPAEIIISKSEREWAEGMLRSVSFPHTITRLEPWLFEGGFAEPLLLRHFNVQTLKGFGAEGLAYGLRAAGVVLHYVGETQRSSLAQITGLRVMHADDVMLLDASTRKALDIQPALIEIMDHTKTPMGARLVRWWIQAPLLRRDEIEARLDIVKEFSDNPHILDTLRDELSCVGDIERLIVRIVSGKANARDLVALRNGLDRLPAIKRLCSESPLPKVKSLCASISLHEEVTAYLHDALRDDPAVVCGKGQIFRPGFSAELDTLTSALTDGKSWIAAYQDDERRESGISTLKIGVTGVFGYYIEVTNTHAAKVPPHYQRKQTLTNAERYTTDRLRALEHTLVHAESSLTELELSTLALVRVFVSDHCARIQQTAETLATVDVLAGFADVARTNNYVAPIMHDGGELEICGARHPIIEMLLPHGTTYTANTITIDPEGEQIHLITGPNMSGKSSYLRQTALIVFLAHVGSFVPATSARIPCTDRIFTRVGAQDNIMAGESTFLVEMQETANILNNATKRSLILLDEVGRGTATFDGISIAWALVEYLHNVVGAKTLFATHYHELASMADTFERIRNYQVEVREVADTIVFTHRVVPGHSDHSFGIHVARMAGLPPAVLVRARAVLREMESGREKPDQMSLFEYRDDTLRERLREIDTSNMTPLQALQTLHELKESING